MIEPKVSIIVPVYNAGKYFKNCIESLQKQSLQEIEIILILDCPTDGSDKIAESYANQDDRIVLVHNKTNLHVGESRNVGINKARGQYIGFFDHDDYCAPAMYETLYTEAVKTKADIVRSNYSFQLNEKLIPINKVYIDSTSLLTEVISKRTPGFIWNHIFRKEFIIQNNCKFVDTRIITGEDTLFLIDSCMKTANYSTIDDNFYVHVSHTSSTGAQQSYYGVDSLLAYYRKLKLIIQDADNLYSFMLMGLVWEVFSISKRGFSQLAFKKAMTEINKLKQTSLFREIFQQLFRLKNLRLITKIAPKAILSVVLIRILPIQIWAGK